MKVTVSATVSPPVAPNQLATVGATPHDREARARHHADGRGGGAPARARREARVARAEVLADERRGRRREAEPRHEREGEDADADHVGRDRLGAEAGHDAQEHEEAELPGELLDRGRQPDAQDAPQALAREPVEPGAALDGELVALPERRGRARAPARKESPVARAEPVGRRGAARRRCRTRAASARAGSRGSRARRSRAACARRPRRAGRSTSTMPIAIGTLNQSRMRRYWPPRRTTSASTPNAATSRSVKGIAQHHRRGERAGREASRRAARGRPRASRRRRPRAPRAPWCRS